MVVPMYGGTPYRENANVYNSIFNPILHASISHEGDLMGLGAKNEHLVVPPVDTDWLATQRAERSGRDRIVVGHFPSNANSKGTHEIIPAVQSLGELVEFRHSKVLPPTKRRRGHHDARVEHQPWTKHVERLAECDVVVDQIKEYLGSYKFGEWCTNALEAASLGCVVIANSHTVDIYQAAYGRPPGIHVCNTMEEMVQELKRIAALSPGDLKAEQDATQAWAQECHSYKATGWHIENRVY
jgi:hypothetical protein